MRKIYLFLVASEDTLEQERMEITNLVRSMNERYSTKNIRVRLFKTGEAMIYNMENINDSEMVFLICHKNISPDDLNCFNKALEHFQSSEDPKTPRIITYFKSEEESRSNNLLQFLTHLDEDLGHYYTEYQVTDSLKYHILLNLLSLEDSFVVEYKDENILVDGHSFGSMKNMACMANHTHLQDLKNEYEKTVSAFYDAMDEYDDNPTPENDSKYVSLGTKKEALKKEIQLLETNIFGAMRNLSKAVGNGELSPRSKEAYRLLELGEYEKADEILDFEDISNDISHQLEILQAVEETKQKVILKLRKTIDELLQKIETLQLRVDYQERFLEIEKCYEKAVLSEIEAGIEPSVGLKYVYYLQEQSQHEKAIGLVKLIIAYYNDSFDRLGKMDAFNLLGWSYRSTDDYEEAIDSYMQAIEIAESIIRVQEEEELPYLCTTNSKLGVLLSASYNEIGIVFSDIMENHKAEFSYQKSLEIRELLCNLYPYVYDLRLASSYGNMGLLYEDKLDYDMAEKYYSQAIDSVKKYLEYNGEDAKQHLILHYRNLGNLYKTTNDIEKAEDILLEALELSKYFAKINPQAYEQKLADCYGALGNLYFYSDRESEAEGMYLQSFDLYEKLLNRSFPVFVHGMAISSCQLAVCYDYMDYVKEAKYLYEKTADYLEYLVQKDASLYQEDLDNLYIRINDLEANNDNSSLEQYIYPSNEFTLQDIFSYSGNGKPWVAKGYDIYQNEENEILFLLPYTGEFCNLSPIGAKLFYDGKKHAVLRGVGLPLMICDHINIDIREGVISQKEILVAFSNGGLDEDSVTSEFMAEVVYLPDMPISKKAEYHIDSISWDA